MKNVICKDLLEREYIKRKQRNSAYSLRAFAKYLGIGIASLSDCLSLKRSLSKKNILKIIDKLELSPHEAEILLAESQKALTKTETDLYRLKIKDDQFKIMSDWYHFAILELALIKDHKATPVWVAHKLGISVIEAQVAIERLVNLKFLTIKRNKFQRMTAPVIASSATPSSAIRRRRKQLLDLAKESIDNDPLEDRAFWDTTMAIDPKNIEKAREMLIKYSRKICKTLETGNQKEIYQLSVGLFPLKKR